MRRGLGEGFESVAGGSDMQANIREKYQPLPCFVHVAGKQFLDNTGDKTNQLKEYVVPDLSVSYRLPFQKQDVSLRFLLNNFTNTKYVNNGYVDDGPVYFAQAGINFMFGVSVKIK